jgi:hypothetical protein
MALYKGSDGSGNPLGPIQFSDQITTPLGFPSKAVSKGDRLPVWTVRPAVRSNMVNWNLYSRDSTSAFETTLISEIFPFNSLTMIACCSDVSTRGALNFSKSSLALRASALALAAPSLALAISAREASASADKRTVSLLSWEIFSFESLCLSCATFSFAAVSSACQRVCFQPAAKLIAATMAAAARPQILISLASQTLVGRSIWRSLNCMPSETSNRNLKAARPPQFLPSRRPSARKRLMDAHICCGVAQSLPKAISNTRFFVSR